MQKRVIELFAGVGGFRVGLNHVNAIGQDGTAIENGPYDFVWANQWEPSTKSRQDAFSCYVSRFGREAASNKNIHKVEMSEIPEHDLLVGGFPCQDYSVARTISSEKGINGKKGVLWWDIRRILLNKQPAFVLLENVDRLLKAPAKQRGQAFGIMLRCFNEAGYGVQWKVINAAEYGHAQKRKRVFIFAFHESTRYFRTFSRLARQAENKELFIKRHLMFSRAFPIQYIHGTLAETSVSPDLYKEIADVSETFKFDFQDAGFCINYAIATCSTEAAYEGGYATLRSVLIPPERVNQRCWEADAAKFEQLKAAHKISRTTKDGKYTYIFSEGAIPFPDVLDKPSRTMLTSEGTTNRSTHFILDPVRNEYRTLDPVECERLDEFPDDWTNTGMSRAMRYFICGNALVTGLISSMGDQISTIIEEEP